MSLEHLAPRAKHQTKRVSRPREPQIISKYTVYNQINLTLLLALNATLAVERVRPRRNQAEEAEEESTDLVSHVLNPDLPLHHPGNY